MSLDEARSQLAKLVRERMAELGVPGVAVAVHRDGEEYIDAFGVTNVSHPLDVDENTLFQVGSTTKTLTALVALRLVQEGRADLDEPVKTYLPDLELASLEVTNHVTLRHLLTHTAGFDGDFFDDFGPGDDALACCVERMRDLPQVTPLGKVWNYNNAGFALAGHVIEAITGLTFELATRQVVLEPLGMDHSCYLASEAITHGVAVGHATTDAGPTVMTPWQLPRSINPAGGLISSARDQLTYATFHLGDGTSRDGTRIIDHDALVQMRTPQIRADGGRAAHAGISWLIQRTPGVLAHGGSTIGQESAFVVVPDHGFAITVLTNADRGVVLQREVSKWALRNLVDLERPTNTQVPAAPDALDQYVGTYRAAAADVEVARGERGLEFTVIPRVSITDGPNDPSPAMPVEMYDGGAFKVLDGPFAPARGDVLRNDDGDLVWLRLQGRVHARIAG